MKIVIFGATGQVGGRILQEALTRGHRVTAFVRDIHKLATKHDLLDIYQGDARDPERVAAALRGHEAVISALGSSHPDDAVDIRSMGITNIAAGMRDTPLRRLVTLGTGGILQLDEHRLRLEAPMYPAMLKGVATEHLKGLEILRASDLDWTMVCPPSLEEGESSGSIRVKEEYMPEGGKNIAIGDVAAFVVDELERPRYIRKRVGISS